MSLIWGLCCTKGTILSNKTGWIITFCSDKLLYKWLKLELKINPRFRIKDLDQLVWDRCQATEILLMWNIGAKPSMKFLHLKNLTLEINCSEYRSMVMGKDLVSKRLPSTLPLPKKIEKNLEVTTLILQFLAVHTHLFNTKSNQIIMLLWVQRL